ncbi:hypothetical protein HK102_013445 [Quaeritorhiza haematococci]|nr:hypothetical protein HK102_013445 [Quaeritorhiza haematococci]
MSSSAAAASEHAETSTPLSPPHAADDLLLLSESPDIADLCEVPVEDLVVPPNTTTASQTPITSSEKPSEVTSVQNGKEEGEDLAPEDVGSLYESIKNLLDQFREIRNRNGAPTPDDYHIRQGIWNTYVKLMDSMDRTSNLVVLQRGSNQDEAQISASTSSLSHEPPPTVSTSTLSLSFSFFLSIANITKRFRNGTDRIQRTQRVLEDMKKFGYTPGMMGAETVMVAYTGAGRDSTRQAQRVMRQAMRDGYPPRTRTYHILLGVMAREFGPLVAEKWFNGLVRKEVLVVADDYYAPSLHDVRPEFNVVMKAVTNRIFQDELGRTPVILAAPPVTIDTNPAAVPLPTLSTQASDSNLSPLVPNGTTYTILISACARYLHFPPNINPIRLAQWYMDKMEKEGFPPTTWAWSALIFGHVRAGDMQGAMRCYREIVARKNQTGLGPNRVIYETLIHGFLGRQRQKVDTRSPVGAVENERVLANRGDVEELGAGLNFGVGSGSGGELASSPSSINMAEALDLYEDMIASKYAPGVVTYHLFIKAYIEIDRVDKARAMFDEMIASGLQPDVHIYTTLIDAYMSNQQPWRATELVQMVNDAGIEPDVVLYSALIHGHARCGDFARAAAVEREMRSHAPQLKPTYQTYHILMHMHCLNGDMPSAWEVLEEMEADERGFKRTEFTYNILLHGYGLLGDLEATQTLLKAMRYQSGISPSVTTYNTLIMAHARAGDQEGAMQWYSRILQDGMEPDVVTYNILISANGAALNAVGALEAYQALLKREDLKPTKYTFLPLIGMYAKMGEVDQARQAQQLMLEELGNKQSGSADDLGRTSSSSSSSGSPSISRMQPYNLIINSEARAGRIPSALDELARAQQDGVNPDVRTFDMIIRAHGAAGDVEGARKWMDIALYGGDSGSPPVVPDTQLFNALAYAYAKVGDRDGASAVVKEMEEWGLQSDMFTYTTLLKAATMADAAAAEAAAKTGSGPTSSFNFSGGDALKQQKEEESAAKARRIAYRTAYGSLQSALRGTTDRQQHRQDFRPYAGVGKGLDDVYGSANRSYGEERDLEQDVANSSTSGQQRPQRQQRTEANLDMDVFMEVVQPDMFGGPSQMRGPLKG